MKKTLVLGGPGAGKTTRLLDVMEEMLDHGIKPDRIAFCSFTRAACQIGRVRAMNKFKLKEDDLPYFRTLHSLCYRGLNLNHTRVLQADNLKELLDHLGMEFDENFQLDIPGLDMDMPLRHFEVHPIVSMDHLARTTNRSQQLDKVYEEKSARGYLDFTLNDLQHFSDSYALHKEKQDLCDFTDMLIQFDKEGIPLDIDVAIFDEVQDFTPLQWKVAMRIAANAFHLWAGGDDDQSIYDWAGAAKDHLLTLGWPTENLERSHRLPRRIFEVSRIFLNRIERRYLKTQRADDREGEVHWVTDLDQVDMSKGEWLMMARTRHLTRRMVGHAHGANYPFTLFKSSSINPKHIQAIDAYLTLQEGRDPIDHHQAIALFSMLGRRPPKLEEDKPYGAGDLNIDLAPKWHDALVGIGYTTRMYYLNARQQGEQLRKEPRIRISTIHAAKGAECANVVLALDMTKTVSEGFDADPDPEHRAFYVGATRASEKLFLLEPRRYRNAYPFESSDLPCG